MRTSPGDHRTAKWRARTPSPLHTASLRCWASSAAPNWQVLQFCCARLHHCPRLMHCSLVRDYTVELSVGCLVRYKVQSHLGLSDSFCPALQLTGRPNFSTSADVWHPAHSADLLVRLGFPQIPGDFSASLMHLASDIDSAFCQSDWYLVCPEGRQSTQPSVSQLHQESDSSHGPADSGTRFSWGTETDIRESRTADWNTGVTSPAGPSTAATPPPQPQGEQSQPVYFLMVWEA